MKKILGLILSLFPATLLAAPGTLHYVGSLQAEVKQSASETPKQNSSSQLEEKWWSLIRRTRGFWWALTKQGGGEDGWIHKRHLKSSDPDGIRY